MVYLFDRRQQPFTGQCRCVLCLRKGDLDNVRDRRGSTERGVGVEKAVLGNSRGASKPETKHLPIISTGCWAGWWHLTKCLFFDTSITTHFPFSSWSSPLCYPTDRPIGTILQTHLRTCRLSSWYYTTVSSYPTLSIIYGGSVKFTW